MEEEKIRDKMSSDYVWTCMPATKEHKKGRAKGGIITAVSKRLEKIETRRLNNVALENKLEYNNGNKWRIITLYSQKTEETMEV